MSTRRSPLGAIAPSRASFAALATLEIISRLSHVSNGIPRVRHRRKCRIHRQPRR
jgi:hypothetical protein